MTPIRPFEAVRYRVDGRDLFAMRAPAPGRDGHVSPPVVLVHGLGLSHRYMMPTAQMLARHYAVLVPDLPGFGDSARARGPLTVTGMGDALARWMAAAELGPACLVANSHGCQIAAALAARHPALVGCAVLQGPTAPPADRTWLRQYVHWRRNAPYNPQALNPIAWADYRRAGRIRVLRAFRQSLFDGIEDRLAAIRAPVLVVRGQCDPICSQDWAERIAAGLADGALVMIPGVSHTLCYSAPEEIAAVTVPFVEDYCRRYGRR